MKLEKDIDIALAEYLYEEYVIKGFKHTYKDAAAVLSKRLGRHVDPHMGLPHPLGRISVFCFTELDLPLLSVGIYGADSNAPGAGFYKLACEFRPEYSSLSPREAEKHEHTKVRECRDWQRLRDYLDGVPVDVIMRNAKSTEQKDEGPQNKQQSVVFSLSVSTSDPVFPDEVDASESSISEGAVKSVLVNVRERNPRARKMCLEANGTVCAVCDVDLGSVYGAEFSGKVHVHHLKPISEHNDEHDIDPVKDLCPVCPNCHMIMHCRQDKPYSIGEVKAFMTDAKQK